MQLNLNTFHKKITNEERIDQTIASGIAFKGLDNVPHLQSLLQDLLSNYELDKGVMKLISEYCDQCKHKLKRKGTYKKEITLPGGVAVLLTFYQYSCLHCKKKTKENWVRGFQKEIDIPAILKVMP